MGRITLFLGVGLLVGVIIDAYWPQIVKFLSIGRNADTDKQDTTKV